MDRAYYVFFDSIKACQIVPSQGIVVSSSPVWFIEQVHKDLALVRWGLYQVGQQGLPVADPCSLVGKAFVRGHPGILEPVAVEIQIDIEALQFGKRVKIYTSLKICLFLICLPYQ